VSTKGDAGNDGDKGGNIEEDSQNEGGKIFPLCQLVLGDHMSLRLIARLNFANPMF
jgi:hypothetical protein